MLIGVDASRALRANRTGTERYALEIIRHLLALPAASAHEWRLYTDRPAPLTVFAAPDARNVTMRAMPARRLWTHRVLARELGRSRPDRLFVPAHVLPLIWPSRRLPPCVVTVHDLGYRHFPDSHPFVQRIYLDWSTRWNARAAARLIAVSKATAHDLHTIYGTPAAKIEVIYEATAAVGRPSEAARREILSRYGLVNPFALYVGTIQPRKNLVRLIQAYTQIAAAADFDLVLVGKPGWYSTPILGNVPHHLRHRVHYLGYVPDDTLPAFMAAASQFCFPSLFEGFGLPVLEAQSFGVPVMTANNSSLPEVAGDAAILVDPTDVDAIAAAMQRLSQDETLRQQLIEAGYRNVQRFSWEKAARETLTVLENAAGDAELQNPESS